ncbi:ribonuclease J [Azospirillum doebereinerae]|uniref:Ribonuclease J n=1 Tax=Azospirillum doebereinerae TaxID=92933 RepID=A0A3S0XNE4_9PROT|nr:ribonuclease J [Azospirillum doebereinerae]MCG5243824.1 ribonuclease J [Azospirillum doebereinerae]RUQ72150.1 ribonuclease J [Azospirillum doebereinerae]
MTFETKRRRSAPKHRASQQRARLSPPDRKPDDGGPVTPGAQARDGRRPASGPVPGTDEILFLPLGGCSRIGMNMALYGHAGKWLIVDAGVAFLGDDAPGIDSLMADPAFILDRMDDVVGLVVTHAHEDHIGAIHHLWPGLRCPIHASPFAAHVIRERMKEAGTLSKVRIREFDIGDTLSLGPFRIQTIAVTHSIPEPVSLAIHTPAGTVLHTGDWKFDPNPLVGQKTDINALKRLGDEGVLAMLCDSTNANVDGATGSEADARAGLIDAFAGRKGAIAVTGFASNVARMTAVLEAAAAHDRKVVLVGRSMVRMEKAARACGYMKGRPNFASMAEASWMPRRNLVLLCTGSQGEERAALSRLARNEHRDLWLERGDTAIFSARSIPGNEVALADVQEHLRGMGVDVVTPADAPVHVSGHPKRDDLRRMYDLVRPRFAVPVHGTIEHLEAHARLARSCGVERALIPEDGDIFRLAREGTSVVGRIEPARLANDGRTLIAWGGPAEDVEGAAHAVRASASLSLAS